MPDSKSTAEPNDLSSKPDLAAKPIATRPQRRPARRTQADAPGAPRPDAPSSRPPALPGPAPFTSRPLGQTPGPDPETPLNEVRLAVGTIVGTHGVGGELKMLLATDDPDQLTSIKRVYIGEEAQPRRLLGVRFHKGMALLLIAGVSRPQQGDALRGQTVRISGKDARPLEPGEFYYYQAIGLTAFDETGNEIGTVSDILETGANAVFVLTPPDGGKEILLPNIPDVILALEPAARRLVVRPLVYWDSQ